MAPSQQLLDAVPAKDDGAPFGQLTVNYCSHSCSDVHTAMGFDRCLRWRKILVLVTVGIRDVVDANHVDRRLGLRVKALNDGRSEPNAGKHCEYHGIATFHRLLR